MGGGNVEEGGEVMGRVDGLVGSLMELIEIL